MKKMKYLGLVFMVIATLFSGCSKSDQIDVKQYEALKAENEKLQSSLAEAKSKCKAQQKQTAAQTKPVAKVAVVQKKPAVKKTSVQSISVGGTVCRNAKGLLGSLDIDLIGTVTDKLGEKIQVKIMDSSSKNPTYNKIHLYKNTVVWDKESNWKSCKK